MQFGIKSLGISTVDTNNKVVSYRPTIHSNNVVPCSARTKNPERYLMRIYCILFDIITIVQFHGNKIKPDKIWTKCITLHCTAN